MTTTNAYKNEITAYLILDTHKKRDCALSAKGVAEYGNIEKTSENLRRIEEECWDYVEAGVMKAIDRRDEKGGGLFFDLLIDA